MTCTRSTACEISQMERRLSVPGDGGRSPTVAIETDCFEAFSPFVGVKNRLLLCEAMPDRLPL